jgi:UDP:flavonoid glycosyltransferase YjiC (YdhE family)
MSRVLLAWELGRHLGHVSRLHALATRLKARNHSVLAVVRDIPSASTVLGPAEVSFIQSPWYTGVPNAAARMAGYADLLLTQGWNDRSALWGTLQAWITIYQMFRPDVIVLDFAPTARLAAKLLEIPSVLIGTGFELPPATTPLPPFPGFSWATQEVAAASEERVLENVNAVLSAARAEPLTALRSLVEADCRFLTTFAALDHYGPRTHDRYLGPLADPLHGRLIDWPAGSERRIFAYLRPQVPELPMLLQGLAAADAGVVAYVPGMPSDLLAHFSTPRCVFSPEPVQFAPLFRDADVCLSYAPSGTVTASLLYGVPQLMLPVHLESQLTAQRVASQGLGRILPTPKSANQVTQHLQEFLDARDIRLRSRGFSERHRHCSPAAAAEVIVEAIEGLCRANLDNSVPNHAGQGAHDAAGTVL